MNARFLLQQTGVDGEGYQGIVTPEDLARRKAEEKKKLDKASRAKAERRCPECDLRVSTEFH